MKITAKQKDGSEVSAEFDFGSNLAEVTTKFGDDATFKAAFAGLKVQFRGWLVSQVVAGRSLDAIQDELNKQGWTPSSRRSRVTKLDKLRSLMAQMDPEERSAFIKEFAKNKAA